MTAGANAYYDPVDNGYGAYESLHAVVALGHNANGLVIQNSWGTDWGDNGYATLAWSFVNSGPSSARQPPRVTTGRWRCCRCQSGCTPRWSAYPRGFGDVLLMTGSLPAIRATSLWSP